MNPMQLFEYGNKKNVFEEPNLIIGQAISTYPDKATLATKLNISESNIPLFEIREGSIFAHVTASFKINQAMSGPHSRIIDLGGNCTSFGEVNSMNFASAGQAREWYFPAITKFRKDDVNWIVQTEALLKDMYFPNCLEWGDVVGADDDNGAFATQGTHLFRNTFTQKPNVYVHPSMMTINNGGLEGDLAYLQTLGATIIPVTNTTAPEPITDLAVEQAYSTAAKLTFTVPYSVNPATRVQVYRNDLYNGEYDLNDGVFVINLPNNTTTTKIKIVLIDSLFNKTWSNEISVTTTAQAILPTSGLLNGYKYEGIGNVLVDQFGNKNGDSTFVTTKGLVGIAGNGAYQYASGDYVEFIDDLIGGLSAFTLVQWVKNYNGIFWGSFNGRRVGEVNWQSGSKRFISYLYIDNVLKGGSMFFPTNHMTSADNLWHCVFTIYTGRYFFMQIDDLISDQVMDIGTGVVNQRLTGETEKFGKSRSIISTGIMSNSLVYNRGLSVPERLEIYNNRNGITI